ncbi:carboxylesterase/lipase family protein [Alicyclobacillus tolerans]|uniref:carboxylesterase/lipase family protein n=1 Tax=Alicyclobacillus tolerans TaxID=90970 RepID=UPI001F47FB69|nr:carboxylesterase/lipase family protein [Alicyclobacillus tolerans]MCF8563458.1 carboxylesterase/lipase family protein [Alicyclobacillus tolerans]
MPVAQTSYGPVKGTLEGKVTVFRGIPYAQPPTGSLRFRPPAAPNPWSAVFDAACFGPVAPQPAAPTLLPRAELPQSENCLTLNIWTPGLDKQQRPVLVWLHGGGLITGSGADPYSMGDGFAEDGVVFVSVNYRLGSLGFLYLGDMLGPEYQTSGNCGVLDVTAALKFVRDNIANFGGNPSRITVGGVSAGAKLAATLHAVPDAKGLFQQTILQSGANQTIRSTQTASVITAEFLDALGLGRAEAHRILDLPVSDLISAQTKIGQGPQNFHRFGPVLDGVVFPTGIRAGNEEEHLAPEAAFSGPILIGTAKSEARILMGRDPMLADMNPQAITRLFGDNSGIVLCAYRKLCDTLPHTEAACQVLTDYMYGIGSERFADGLSAAGVPVWRYRFDWKGPHGACHVQDMPFVWNKSFGTEGLFAIPIGRKTGAEHGSSPVQALAAAVHKAWISFVKTGSPGIPELPQWPQYTRERREVMLFDETCQVAILPRLDVEDGFPEQVLAMRRDG